jgi:HD-GYP domain-containing protein (c-di-GMP phosphodiesterase class II)
VRTVSLVGLAGSSAQNSGLAISVSTGVSDLPGSAGTRDELLAHADIGLYAAKGRRPANRVVDDSQVATHDAPAPALGLDRVAGGLAVAVGARDVATRDHCDAVARYAAAIGERLGLGAPELTSLRRVALVHDAGKLGIPDVVLLKPGPLTPQERSVMQEHSALGYRIVLAAGLPECEAVAVLHHHEHLDGSGYPLGLRGDEIPLPSRILLVADAFDAMTTGRPYRPAGAPSAALAELRRCAGTQFDPRAVEALANALTDAAALTPAPDAAAADAPGWRLIEAAPR